jgi:cobalt/nickel transport system ATP-binding protein
METHNQNRLIIHLEDITFAYPENSLNTIDHLNLKLCQKDRMGIVAPNGCGKTTLFSLIMGLLSPDSGQIKIFGDLVRSEKDFVKVRRKIGLLFQDSDDQLFSPTVIEDVAFGPLNLGYSPSNAKDIAMTTLDNLGLSGYENRITHKLSGGEKRMVALATVLAMQPEALLLDEPNTGLDEKTKSRLVQVLNQLDLPYIVISHENDFLYDTTNIIYTMENGQMFPGEKIHRHHHEHPHSHSHHIKFIDKD